MSLCLIQSQCPECARPRLFEKETTSKVHLLLCVLTSGL